MKVKAVRYEVESDDGNQVYGWVTDMGQRGFVARCSLACGPGGGLLGEFPSLDEASEAMEEHYVEKCSREWTTLPPRRMSGR